MAKNADEVEKSAKSNENVINSTIIGMTQGELVQQHGEAASQMIQALKGTRYDSAGNDLGHQGRSLQGIRKYGTSKEYKEQNIKQQSGFSAELIKEARDNKDAVLNGDPNRTRTTDGIGQTNNTQYDHVKVDANGNPIEGSGSQMKFLQTGVDKDGDRTFKVMDKLAKQEDWDRYDGVVDIPKGDYKDALKYADKQVKKLHEQAKKARESGKSDIADKLDKQADGYEKSKERIRESNVGDSEAIQARTNPNKFVAKEVVKDSHNAGIEAAKGALIISGSISAAQNIYAVVAEDKPIDEAILDVAKTTVKSGAVAYGIGAGGTAIKAMMHSSSKEIVRRAGNTNVPVMIATSAVEITKSMKKYSIGEIDEVELLEELGEKGTGMVAAGFASAVGATVGGTIGTVIPVVGTAIGATVGTFIGSMIGYSSSSMLYKGSLEALKGAKISAERRAVIEEISNQAIKETENYRKSLIEFAKSEYNKREEVFYSIFKGIEDSILLNDIDGFILGMNKVGNEFGVKLRFNSFEEIDAFMSDDSTVFRL